MSIHRTYDVLRAKLLEHCAEMRSVAPAIERAFWDRLASRIEAFHEIGPWPSLHDIDPVAPASTEELQLVLDARAELSDWVAKARKKGFTV